MIYTCKVNINKPISTAKSKIITLFIILIPKNNQVIKKLFSNLKITFLNNR